MDLNTALRIMYGCAILGAGIVGLVTLFAPSLAARYVFLGATNVDIYIRILGALWLSLGAVSILGLISPIRFIPILVVQLVYKSLWLLVAAYPALLAGSREVGLIFFAGLFSAWVFALLLMIPFTLVFPTGP
ncbi:MAG: hypothetical protein AAF513_03040 [Pseudomonadota bacterium]